MNADPTTTVIWYTGGDSDDPRALEYGKSITDACIGWGDSLQLLETLSKAVAQRRNR